MQRIDFIDIAKGLAIVLVVFGHTGLRGFFSDWIWSFHMPLFFFVSGLVFDPSKYNTFSLFVKKRLHTLIVPYAIFSIIIFIGFWMLNYNPCLHSIKELLFGWDGIALWFVPVLFFVEILFYILCKNINSIFILLLLLLTGSMIGYFLNEYNVHFYYKLETVLSALFIYGIGYCSRFYILNRFSFSEKYNLLVSFFFFLLLNVIIVLINHPRLDMAWNQVGSYLPGYIGAFSGICWMFCLSRIIDLSTLKVKNVIVYLGKNTFVILAFHQFLSALIRKCLEELPMSSYLNSLLRQIILWILLIFFISLINKYFSCILGRKLPVKY